MLQHYYKGEAKISLIYYYTRMVRDQLADGRSHILLSPHTVRSDQSTTMDRNNLHINKNNIMYIKLLPVYMYTHGVPPNMLLGMRGRPPY